MAFTDPGDVTSGSTGTEAWANAVRASLLATGVAIVTTKGDLAIATGKQTLARVAAGANDSILVADSTQTAGVAWQIQPAVHVTKSGTTSMGTGAWTSIEFDTETSDTDGMHDGVTNPSRLTVPSGGGGWYLFGFNGTVSGGNPNSWMARILLNGTTALTSGGVWRYDAGPLSISGLYPLSAADYLEVQYYVTSAGHTLDAGHAFWAIWQRRQ